MKSIFVPTQIRVFILFFQIPCFMQPIGYNMVLYVGYNILCSYTVRSELHTNTKV